ncbi:MAG TPA: PD-(D/E)XK nuclease family protein [Myxococcota bacterium]|nr:PD-(D/E)XK nuclease family protein [Myxococcota bacterium]
MGPESVLATIYSHSRLSSFENCPKQFHYRYVLRIPSETESIEAFLGKRVHEVLERLYGVAREGRGLPSIEKVVHRFRALWDEAYDAVRVRIAREGLDAGAYREIGERCLRNHYRRHYPFDAEETVGLEERVTFSLASDGGYRMQGVIDRIARTRDGALEIHDYKTGARVPNQRALDEDRQLALYELGVRTRFGHEAEVRLVWHYLQAGVTRTSSRTAFQLEALRERTIGLIDRIEGEQRYEPRRGPLCGWCEYRAVCPAFAGEAAARAAEEAAIATPAPAPPEVEPVPAQTQLGLFARG